MCREVVIVVSVSRVFLIMEVNYLIVYEELIIYFMGINFVVILILSKLIIVLFVDVLLF